MSKVKTPKAPKPPVIPDIDLSGIKLPVMKVYNPFKVRPLQGQIREQFLGINELAQSINEVGQAMPVVVTEVFNDPYCDAQLVDGERRLKACQQLKRGVIAFIWDGETDPEDIYAVSVAANFGRQAHNAIEVLKAIERFKKNNKTIEQISRIFGKSIAWVTQHYSLHKLHPTVQQWLVPPIFQTDGNVSEPIFSASSMEKLGTRKNKPAISFQMALRLAGIPMELQIHHGREIISKGMSDIEAQRYLAKVERGVSGERRSRSPSERRSSFLSITDRVRHMVGAYMDMPGKEINGIVDSLSASDLARAQKSLDKIAEDAQALSQVIHSALEKR